MILSKIYYQETIMHLKNTIHQSSIISICLIFLLTLLISACSTQTQLYERWNDVTYSGPKLNKVLVIGVFKDDIRRRAFEMNFVNSVNTKGEHAIAGYTLLPENETYKTKEDIMAAVKKSGVDSVLITSYKGTKEKKRDVAPRIDYAPSMGRYGNYGYGYRGYYGSRYASVYRPGYTVTDTIVQLETRVFSVSDEKLIWAGKSKSTNVSSNEEVVKELVKLVVEDLRKSNLIQ